MEFRHVCELVYHQPSIWKSRREWRWKCKCQLWERGAQKCVLNADGSNSLATRSLERRWMWMEAVGPTEAMGEERYCRRSSSGKALGGHLGWHIKQNQHPPLRAQRHRSVLDIQPQSNLPTTSPSLNKSNWPTPKIPCLTGMVLKVFSLQQMWRCNSSAIARYRSQSVWLGGRSGEVAQLAYFR